MSLEIAPAEWVDCLSKDYLEIFVRAGGSAVRFGVAVDEETRLAASTVFAEQARRLGYLPVLVDAATTRVHMIDHVFASIAAQIPWADLARRVNRKTAEEIPLRWPATETDDLFGAVALANSSAPEIVRHDLLKALKEQVYDREGLAGQFRSAMYWMCRSLLENGPSSTETVEALTDWLTRRTRGVSRVKEFGIGSAIQRATARYYLESLARWVRMAGLPGMAVILDISRIGLVRNPLDGKTFYTQLAAYDTFETLRKLIDGVERLEGTLVAVLPGPNFDHEDDRRGLFSYAALRFRIADDVHDARRANPTGMLVRLGG